MLIPTIIGITLITFSITRAVPGGPLEKILNDNKFNSANETAGSSFVKRSHQGLNDNDIEYLKNFYGLDKPILSAYFEWLKKVILFDLGDSYRYFEPVTKLIIERLPISIYFGLTSTIIVYLVCIPLGVLKALNHRNFYDLLISILIYFGYAVPSFVLGVILQVYLAGELGWFPIGGFNSSFYEELTPFEKVTDVLHHSFLPLICYLIGGFASMTIMMKNSLLENLMHDYVRTAYAKGLKKREVIVRHVLRNSLLPIVYSIGQNISLILSGSFLIETIFNIDGLGLLGYKSLSERDYPVVMGTLYISGLLFLIGNIISDICISFLDPRIKFK